jgi:uncharacterized iron-regulated membrane protein
MSTQDNLLERVWRRPQGIWARRALFQIHLWSGIAAGLYLVMISLTGSLLVYRVELDRMFVRKEPVTVAVQGEPMSEDALKAAALRAYPSYEIMNYWEAKGPDRPVEIWLTRGTGRSLHRMFDPYTGKDLGHPDPIGLRFMMFSTSLHDDLLTGETGRKANGIGAIALALLCVTGLVIWWPGVTSWRRSLTVDLKSNWKLFNWNLHSAAGFWGLLIVFLWALSGIYLAFPAPFQDVVDYLEPFDEANPGIERFGDVFLQWLTRLHFGRFGGWPIKATWTVIGLLPLILFVTGAVMWWNRVLSRFIVRLRASK